MSLPRLAMLLAHVDRPDFYRRLHEHDTIFLLENPRAWLVVGYEDTARMLRHPLLISNRDGLAAALSRLVDSRIADAFYRQWLMYMDGEAHEVWRTRFTRAASIRSATPAALPLPGIEDAAKRFIQAGQASITDFCIRPFVIRAVSQFAGIQTATLEYGYALLAPVLTLLHGRDCNPCDVTQVRHSLEGWPLFLAAVRREACGVEEGLIPSFLTGADSLQAVGVGLLPLIDVVDPIISLCGALAMHRVSQVGASSLMTSGALVREMVRLHSPFLVCNRTAVGKLEDVPDMPCSPGDRVTLLIAAANRDPRVFEDPDVLIGGRARAPLSFGLGTHSCPGRPWSMAVLEQFCFQFDMALRMWPSRLQIGDTTHFDGPSFAGVRSVSLRLDS